MCSEKSAILCLSIYHFFYSFINGLIAALQESNVFSNERVCSKKKKIPK